VFFRRRLLAGFLTLREMGGKKKKGKKECSQLPSPSLEDVFGPLSPKHIHEREEKKSQVLPKEKGRRDSLLYGTLGEGSHSWSHLITSPERGKKGVRREGVPYMRFSVQKKTNHRGTATNKTSGPPPGMGGGGEGAGGTPQSASPVKSPKRTDLAISLLIGRRPAFMEEKGLDGKGFIKF